MLIGALAEALGGAGVLAAGFIGLAASPGATDGNVAGAMGAARVGGDRLTPGAIDGSLAALDFELTSLIE